MASQVSIAAHFEQKKLTPDITINTAIFACAAGISFTVVELVKDAAADGDWKI